MRFAEAQPNGVAVQELEVLLRAANSTAKFRSLQHYVRQTLRRWLWRKHGCTRGHYDHYTNDRLHGHYGLWGWPLQAAWTTA